MEFTGGESVSDGSNTQVEEDLDHFLGEENVYSRGEAGDIMYMDTTYTKQIHYTTLSKWQCPRLCLYDFQMPIFNKLDHKIN